MQAIDRTYPPGDRSARLGFLLDRCARVRDAVGRACEDGERLCLDAARLQRRAGEARLMSRRRSQYARVEGTVEGHLCAAIVHRDGTVTGDVRLLRRVDVIVSLGETFDDGRLVATRGQDPLVTILAATRACDRVGVVEVFGDLGRRR